MKSRVARIIFAVFFLAIFGVYTYKQELIHSHSVDVESWGEATGLHPEGFEEGLSVVQETQEPVAVDYKPEQTVEPEPAVESEPTDEPEPTVCPFDMTSWELMLVNNDHPVGDYTPEEFVTLSDSQCIQDARIGDALWAFYKGCIDAGLPCYLSSGYRSYAEQSASFQNKINQVGSEEAAARIVARPGTSEHQTGLCCDITDYYRNPKDESLENTETFKWLNEHCAEYGFILRYPKDKQEITGIMYEPWHFRYVGVEAAAYIKENGLCLEEFWELFG